MQNGELRMENEIRRSSDAKPTRVDSLSSTYVGFVSDYVDFASPIIIRNIP